MIRRHITVGLLATIILILLAMSCIVSGATQGSAGITAQKSPYLITDAVTGGASHTYSVMRPD